MTDQIEFIEVAVRRGWKKESKIDLPVHASKVYGVCNFWSENGYDFCTWEQIITDKSLWKAIYGEDNVCMFCGNTEASIDMDNDEDCFQCGQIFHPARNNSMLVPLWRYKMIQFMLSDQQDEWIKREVAQLKEVE